ncbi:predicted protein [Postia placenta Mad-698-R]|nr:predicted protein [Postia placenta Mad-698-R]
MSFTIERIIDFSLRAIESRNASDRVSKFFISWLQTTYAAGFISIGQDLAIVARTYLVHTTMGSIDKPITPFRSTDQPEAPLTSYYGDSASSSSSGYRDLSLSVDEADREDELRRRFWIRRFTVSGGTYYAGETNTSQAQLTQQTRFNRIAATIIALILLQVTNWVTIVVWWTSRGRVQLMPVLIICADANLLTVTCIYRLSVMPFQTTNLLSMGSHSLNTPLEKAAFYAFHIAPEWIAGAILLCVNVKEMFHTGLTGDWRSTDSHLKTKPPHEEKLVFHGIKLAILKARHLPRPKSIARKVPVHSSSLGYANGYSAWLQRRHNSASTSKKSTSGHSLSFDWRSGTAIAETWAPGRYLCSMPHLLCDRRDVLEIFSFQFGDVWYLCVTAGICQAMKTTSDDLECSGCLADYSARSFSILSAMSGSTAIHQAPPQPLKLAAPKCRLSAAFGYLLPHTIALGRETTMQNKGTTTEHLLASMDATQHIHCERLESRTLAHARDHTPIPPPMMPPAAAFGLDAASNMGVHVQTCSGKGDRECHFRRRMSLCRLVTPRPVRHPTLFDTSSSPHHYNTATNDASTPRWNWQLRRRPRHHGFTLSTSGLGEKTQSFKPRGDLRRASPGHGRKQNQVPQETDGNHGTRDGPSVAAPFGGRLRVAALESQKKTHRQQHYGQHLQLGLVARGLWRKLHWRNSETTARRGGRLGARFYATANTFTPGFAVARDWRAYGGNFTGERRDREHNHSSSWSAGLGTRSPHCAGEELRPTTAPQVLRSDLGTRSYRAEVRVLAGWSLVA